MTDQLQSEIEEQARLLGMSAQREARLLAVIEQYRSVMEKFAYDVERCYRMLLSDADVKGALFKAENILREALAEQKVGAGRTAQDGHNAALTGATPNGGVSTRDTLAPDDDSPTPALADKDCEDADVALLDKYGEKGLRDIGYLGVIDRLERSGHISSNY